MKYITVIPWIFVLFLVNLVSCSSDCYWNATTTFYSVTLAVDFPFSDGVTYTFGDLNSTSLNVSGVLIYMPLCLTLVVDSDSCVESIIPVQPPLSCASQYQPTFSVASTLVQYEVLFKEGGCQSFTMSFNPGVMFTSYIQDPSVNTTSVTNSIQLIIDGDIMSSCPYCPAITPTSCSTGSQSQPCSTAIVSNGKVSYFTSNSEQALVIDVEDCVTTNSFNVTGGGGMITSVSNPLYQQLVPLCAVENPFDCVLVNNITANQVITLDFGIFDDDIQLVNDYLWFPNSTDDLCQSCPQIVPRCFIGNIWNYSDGCFQMSTTQTFPSMETVVITTNDCNVSSVIFPLPGCISETNVSGCSNMSISRLSRQLSCVESGYSQWLVEFPLDCVEFNLEFNVNVTYSSSLLVGLSTTFADFCESYSSSNLQTPTTCVEQCSDDSLVVTGTAPSTDMLTYTISGNITNNGNLSLLIPIPDCVGYAIFDQHCVASVTPQAGSQQYLVTLKGNCTTFNVTFGSDILTVDNQYAVSIVTSTVTSICQPVTVAYNCTSSSVLYDEGLLSLVVGGNTIIYVEKGKSNIGGLMQLPTGNCYHQPATVTSINVVTSMFYTNFTLIQPSLCSTSIYPAFPSVDNCSMSWISLDYSENPSVAFVETLLTNYTLSINGIPFEPSSMILSASCSPICTGSSSTISIVGQQQSQTLSYAVSTSGQTVSSLSLDIPTCAISIIGDSCVSSMIPTPLSDEIVVDLVGSCNQFDLSIGNSLVTTLDNEINITLAGINESVVCDVVLGPVACSTIVSQLVSSSDGCFSEVVSVITSNSITYWFGGGSDNCTTITEVTMIPSSNCGPTPLISNSNVSVVGSTKDQSIYTLTGTTTFNFEQTVDFVTAALSPAALTVSTPNGYSTFNAGISIPSCTTTCTNFTAAINLVSGLQFLGEYQLVSECNVTAIVIILPVCMYGAVSSASSCISQVEILSSNQTSVTYLVEFSGVCNSFALNFEAGVDTYVSTVNTVSLIYDENYMLPLTTAITLPYGCLSKCYYTSNNQQTASVVTFDGSTNSGHQSTWKYEINGVNRVFLAFPDCINSIQGDQCVTSITPFLSQPPLCLGNQFSSSSNTVYQIDVASGCTSISLTFGNILIAGNVFDIDRRGIYGAQDQNNTCYYCTPSIVPLSCENPVTQCSSTSCFGNVTFISLIAGNHSATYLLKGENVGSCAASGFFLMDMPLFGTLDFSMSNITAVLPASAPCISNEDENFPIDGLTRLLEISPAATFGQPCSCSMVYTDLTEACHCNLITLDFQQSVEFQAQNLSLMYMHNYTDCITGEGCLIENTVLLPSKVIPYPPPACATISTYSMNSTEIVYQFDDNPCQIDQLLVAVPLCNGLIPLAGQCVLSVTLNLGTTSALDGCIVTAANFDTYIIQLNGSANCSMFSLEFNVPVLYGNGGQIGLIYQPDTYDYCSLAAGTFSVPTSCQTVCFNPLNDQAMSGATIAVANYTSNSITYSLVGISSGVQTTMFIALPDCIVSLQGDSQCVEHIGILSSEGLPSHSPLCLSTFYESQTVGNIVYSINVSINCDQFTLYFGNDIIFEKSGEMFATLSFSDGFCAYCQPMLAPFTCQFIEARAQCNGYIDACLQAENLFEVSVVNVDAITYLVIEEGDLLCGGDLGFVVDLPLMSTIEMTSTIVGVTPASKTECESTNAFDQVIQYSGNGRGTYCSQQYTISGLQQCYMYAFDLIFQQPVEFNQTSSVSFFVYEIYPSCYSCNVGPVPTATLLEIPPPCVSLSTVSYNATSVTYSIVNNSCGVNQFLFTLPNCNNLQPLPGVCVSSVSLIDNSCLPSSVGTNIFSVTLDSSTCIEFSLGFTSKVIYGSNSTIAFYAYPDSYDYCVVDYNVDILVPDYCQSECFNSDGVYQPGSTVFANDTLSSQITYNVDGMYGIVINLPECVSVIHGDYCVQSMVVLPDSLATSCQTYGSYLIEPYSSCHTFTLDFHTPIVYTTENNAFGYIQSVNSQNCGHCTVVGSPSGCIFEKRGPSSSCSLVTLLFGNSITYSFVGSQCSSLLSVILPLPDCAATVLDSCVALITPTTSFESNLCGFPSINRLSAVVLSQSCSVSPSFTLNFNEPMIFTSGIIWLNSGSSCVAVNTSVGIPVCNIIPPPTPPEPPSGGVLAEISVGIGVLIISVGFGILFGFLQLYSFISTIMNGDLKKKSY